MFSIQKIRYVAALLLVLLVSMPSALTAAPVAAKRGITSGFCRLLLSLWEKEGSSLDPDGKLTAGLRSCAKADEGSSVDPNSLHRTKEGSSLDPNGSRTSTTDSGSSVDPSGLHSTATDSGSSLDPNGRR